MGRVRGASYPARKDADGNRLCRWCGGRVSPPRRTFCRQKCVDEFLAATDWNVIRRNVEKRDRGVCAACGCDTAKLNRVLAHAFGWKRAAFEKLLGFKPGQSYWEADHVVEVVRGGTDDLSNLQSLCCPCHKAKTRTLHAALARERRDARRGLLAGNEIES
jgi:5-methylcytosine-specific restriction enzyme A